MGHKIDPQQLSRFNDWFQSRVRSGCPFCGERDWTVHDELALTSTVEADTHRVDPRHGAAVVQITCDRCAFTASFSATRIGILEADADEPRGWSGRRG